MPSHKNRITESFLFEQRALEKNCKNCKEIWKVYIQKQPDGIMIPRWKEKTLIFFLIRAQLNRILNGFHRCNRYILTKTDASERRGLLRQINDGNCGKAAPDEEEL